MPASPTNWNPVQNPQQATASRRHHLAWIVSGIVAVFLLTVACYWPSLGGPFFLDDIPNLELLGERGGLSSADTYVEFITSAQSGPLGRPLSLASFTLDGQNWPTESRPFRVTNLLIHLVNGLLVFLLARLIFASAYKRETAEKLALVCLALWILHPLLVSTTAYVIQRMTQLASFFILTGLIAYMHGRKSLSDKPRVGWAWIIVGMGVSGTLAVFSKETGILLPLYALVIEVTVFSAVGLPGRQRSALITVLCLPLLALLGYMAVSWNTLLVGYEFRPFTLQERLLTQAVVLVDYLHQAVAPHLSGLGIIQDDFPVSTNLLSPAATLLSLLILATLLGLAMWYRKTWPLLSLGILWFFAGNSLEAGPFPLELYFEHRNYVALLGPIIAIASLLPLLAGNLRRVVPMILVVFFCLEIFLTWQSAKMWSDEDLLMRTSLAYHPDSLRAEQYVANQHIYSADYQQALAAQESIATKHPQHTSTRLSILNLRCTLAVLTPEQVAATKEYLERGSYDLQIIGFLEPLLSTAVADACPAFGLVDFQAMLDAMLRNPVMKKNTEFQGAAHYFKGIAIEREGRLDEALEQLDLSYSAEPGIDIRLQQVVWLLTRGRADEAERYLNLARQHRKERFWRGDLRGADIDVLQKQIDRVRGRQ